MYGQILACGQTWSMTLTINLNNGGKMYMKNCLMKEKKSYQTQEIITKKKKINMEFLENGNFNGIKFIGNGNVYNGYLEQEQTWKEYRQWALKNIYGEEN